MTDSKTTNQSTEAAFRIIEEMAPMSESVRVTDLAKRLGMPRTRIYRYLQTLVSLGYVRQDPATERYRLTLKLFHVGQAIADGTQLTSVARPVMMQLRDKTGHTTTLSIPEDGGMRVVDIVRMDSPVQIITKPGALLTFHASAQGKLALAFGKPEFWDGIKDQPLEAFSSLTNTSIDRLRKEIERARLTGWAVAPEETLRGVNAVSAPIFDLQNQFVATITIAGSVQDIKPEPSAAQCAAVTHAARAISADLGCTEYPI
ncbi:IclR family transcriptional regulator [Hoeflea marina]|uniref:IclR family transcriptional regulator n=1 Tax=Hoeflea marina TaxID=274592 RepID=A0A317PI11_9HYPH|nr:IclR family transcriptional regulator [Hoeflea marina]PWV95766.1 IclR family transcriptional regulator [Hoeflea marina]